MRFALAAVLACVALGQDAAAQHRRHASRREPPLAIPEYRAFQHDERIVTRPADSSGLRAVQLEPMVVVEQPELLLTTLFHFPGEAVISPPAHVVVTLIAPRASARSAQRAVVSVTANGAMLRLGDAARVIDTTADPPRAVMELRVPVRTFLRLVNAKRATLAVGSVRFALRREQLEALRDFASRMDPAGFRKAAADAADPLHDWYDATDVDTAARAVLVTRAPAYPDLPESARAMRRVEIQYVVDTTGRIELATLHGRFPERDSAFVDAVRRVAADWEFTPAVRRGRRVRQRVLQLVVFPPPGTH